MSSPGFSILLPENVFECHNTFAPTMSSQSSGKVRKEPSQSTRDDFQRLFRLPDERLIGGASARRSAQRRAAVRLTSGQITRAHCK